MTNDARLRKAIETYAVVLDTCFAMQDGFDSFLTNYKPALQRNCILVPYKVHQELLSVAPGQDNRAYSAHYTIHLLQGAIRDGIAEYRRDPEDDTVINDAVISRVVERLLPRRDVLVLTHDANLTEYLYSKTKQQCFAVKHLLVAGIDRDGHLFAWNRSNRNGRGGKGSYGRRSFQSQTARSKPPAFKLPQPFRPGATLASSLGAPLPARNTLKQNVTVFKKDRSPVVIRRALASGGEGTIYELDDPSLLCKIYRNEKVTVDRQEKIELMLTRNVSDPAICWPRAAVYDADGVFRGFLMPRAPEKTVPLGHGLFIPATFAETNPAWTRRESSALAITILERIKYLHAMNVLIGDINPLNILIADEKTVYFVDCDSYQIEGYPCPVGTVNFTAPEIQSMDFPKFLRTQEHELFAVATLLFMIFMPGKSPYSHRGGADGAANIKAMHFPYPLGERAAESAPEGPWRLCWSHLTYTMKQAFNESFHQDHRGTKRISVERWIMLLNKYAAELARTGNVFRGPAQRVGFDLAILPTNLRRVEKDGEIKPRWPSDGTTDWERVLRRVMGEASVSQSGSTS